MAATGEKKWTYEQNTGTLCNPEGVCSKGIGYSGNGKGKNNSSMENVKNVGPIPRGTYTIGKAVKSDTKGPVTMKLTPGSQDMFGRDAFLIHGDSISHPGSASEGCIILPRTAREEIDKSTVKLLEVIKG